MTSSFLAPATVTAALASLLEAAIGRNESGAVPDARVTALAPNSDKFRADRPGVNIFLYRVTPGPTLRNNALPVRRPDGVLAPPSGVPLTLHYRFTFCGNEEQLEPQRLMGLCVRELSSNPRLSRRQVEETIRLPQYAFLRSSDLGDTGDIVRLMMASPSLEDLSRIWSIFLPAEYRLSVVY
jgi:hypothetical protein